MRAAFDDNVENGDFIAYPYDTRVDNVGTPDRVVSYFFYQGNVIERHYRYEGTTIHEQLSEVARAAGFPAVVPVTLGSGFYGRSDFEDTDVYIKELFRRESAVSEALDKQANPHLAVPEGVVTVQPDGSITVDRNGMVIPVPEGSEAPSYVVWDPSFEAQDGAIMRAEDRILQLSKISKILVDPKLRQSAPTGAALRRLAIPTVNKIRHIRGRLDEAIKLVIMGQAYLHAETGGEVFEVEPRDIKIQWPPELSGGLSDEAEALSTLVEAGILDQATAIQLVTRASKEEARRLAEEQEDEPGTSGT